MTTKLRYSVDLQGIPNGIPVPAYDLGAAPYEVAAYFVPVAGLTIPVPPNDEPDRKSKNITRVVINAENPGALGLSYLPAPAFPTAGVPTQGLIMQPGVLVIPDGVTNIYLITKADQLVTVTFYSGDHKDTLG